MIGDKLQMPVPFPPALSWVSISNQGEGQDTGQRGSNFPWPHPSSFPLSCPGSCKDDFSVWWTLLEVKGTRNVQFPVATSVQWVHGAPRPVRCKANLWHIRYSVTQGHRGEHRRFGILLHSLHNDMNFLLLSTRGHAKCWQLSSELSRLLFFASCSASGETPACSGTLQSAMEFQEGTLLCSRAFCFPFLISRCPRAHSLPIISLP